MGIDISNFAGRRGWVAVTNAMESSLANTAVTFFTGRPRDCILPDFQMNFSYCGRLSTRRRRRFYRLLSFRAVQVVISGPATIISRSIDQDDRPFNGRAGSGGQTNEFGT
jgi:hypothetical protein